MRTIPARACALSLAVLIAATPGCLSWQVTETPVVGSERQNAIPEWKELRARPWNRFQQGALPIRLELYGTRLEESRRTVLRQVELDVYSVTAKVVSTLIAQNTWDGYVFLLIAPPFTLVVDLFLVMFSGPVAPFTRPDDPPAEPEQQVARGEAQQVLEPVALGARLTLDWGDGIPRQQVALKDDGMLYLACGSQASQTLALGRSTARIGIALDEPPISTQITLPLGLLVEAAATEVEADGADAHWKEILEACPPEAEDVRAAVRARQTSNEE